MDGTRLPSSRLFKVNHIALTISISRVYLCNPHIDVPLGNLSINPHVDPDQTQTHPRPSRSIYSIPELICSIPELICSIPEGMLHRHLLSKHSRSGEHHSRTHLTIPDKPETSRILSINPELACSPLNPKTRYAQPRSGKARTLSILPD